MVITFYWRIVYFCYFSKYLFYKKIVTSYRFYPGPTFEFHRILPGLVFIWSGIWGCRLEAKGSCLFRTKSQRDKIQIVRNKRVLWQLILSIDLIHSHSGDKLRKSIFFNIYTTMILNVYIIHNKRFSTKMYDTSTFKNNKNLNRSHTL